MYSGNDPRKASFIQSDMRPHLFKCLNTGTLERFPQYSPKAVKTVCIHRCEPEDITRELYYICRMPDHYDQRMVQCTLCQGWYHYRCMEIRNKKKLEMQHMFKMPGIKPPVLYHALLNEYAINYLWELL